MYIYTYICICIFIGVSRPLLLLVSCQVTSLHYVRCVKPNDGMAPFGFEQARVLRQLQYSGVLEMVRIRRSGFPSRMPFADFEAKFGILLLAWQETPSGAEANASREAPGSGHGGGAVGY